MFVVAVQGGLAEESCKLCSKMKRKVVLYRMLGDLCTESLAGGKKCDLDFLGKSARSPYNLASRALEPLCTVLVQIRLAVVSSVKAVEVIEEPLRINAFKHERVQIWR